MSERQYNEEEAAAIFAKAAEAQEPGAPQVASGAGMTLAELQAIGREVGLSAESVARAAALMDQAARPTTRRFLGLPLGVGRTIDLGRRITDAEWERLVVDLRETFDARGRIHEQGSFRQWTNGNLQVLLEPTPTGHRLRLKTLKGSSLSFMMTGFATLGIALAVAVASALQGGLGDAGTLSSIVTLMAVGVGAFSVGALRLPSWARLRRSQMDGVIERLTHAMAEVPAQLESSKGIDGGRD
jgi:hypothetical protein